MPIKPLPTKLVARLRSLTKKQLTGFETPKAGWEILHEGNQRGQMYSFLGRLKNVDHRKNHPYSSTYDKRDTTFPGRRVRQLDVSINYPKVELVLKRVHAGDAKGVLEAISKNVRIFNDLRDKPKTFLLKPPKAYPIEEEIVAMAKTNNPTVEDILVASGHRISLNITQKEEQQILTTARIEVAEKYFDGLTQKLGIKKAAALKAQIIRACIQARDYMHKKFPVNGFFMPQNLVVVGIKNNQLTLVPYIDLF